MEIDYEGLIAELSIFYQQPALGAAIAEIESIRCFEKYRGEVVKDAVDANFAILTHCRKRADQWVCYSVTKTSESQIKPAPSLQPYASGEIE